MEWAQGNSHRPYYGLVAETEGRDGLSDPECLENHPLSSVTCSGCAPYMTSLANSYANSTNYVGPVSSSWNPSLPNYLGLTSGQTWGCTSDPLPNSGGCTRAAWICSSPCNIVDRFSGTGISWKGYMEGMPGSEICNGNGGSDG